MINDSPYAASLRTHLNFSQYRVEQAITTAQNAVQSWRDLPCEKCRWQRSIEKLEALRASFSEHVSRVAGEGVLQDAVTRHPALCTKLLAIEAMQSQLGEQLNRIADQLSQWRNDDAQLIEIAEGLRDFRSEFAKEQREERHVGAQGLR